MNRVWERASVKGSALLLLLAIADHAHDDGTGAWPSQKTLAAKTRLSARQIRRLLEQLVSRGELRVVPREGASALLTVLTGADNLSTPPALNGQGGADKAVSGGPDMSAGTRDIAVSYEPRTVPEPSIEPSSAAGSRQQDAKDVAADLARVDEELRQAGLAGIPRLRPLLGHAGKPGGARPQSPNRHEHDWQPHHRYAGSEICACNAMRTARQAVSA